LRVTVRLAALTTCTFFAAYAVETYAPTALLTVYRLPAAAVGALAFLGLAVIFAAYLCFGGLSDRWGRRASVIGATAFGGVGFLLYAGLLASGADLGAHPGRLPAGTLTAVLWMLAAAGPLGVQGAWSAELFPTEVRATAVNVAYYVGRGLGGGLAPLGALALAQYLGGDLRLAMVLGLLGLLVALPLALRIPETRGEPLLLTVGGPSAVIPE
jgi:MFS family permease